MNGGGILATTSFLLLSVGALDNFIHERFKKRVSDWYVSTYALAGHRCTQSEIDGIIIEYRDRAAHSKKRPRITDRP